MSPSANPSVVPQASLDAIKVVGKALKKPTVTVKTPFAIDKTRTKVLVPGTGTRLTADGLVTVQYQGVYGRTGKVFDDSFGGDPVTFPLSGVVTGFRDGLVDQVVGSRVLIAMPGSAAYDGVDPSYRPSDYQDGDTLIFVVDIIGGSVAQPHGAAGKTVAGLPTVAGAAADKPAVTMPGGAAPSSMAAVSLIQGTGPAVVKGDTIYVRYVGYSWKTGKLIDDQWTPSSGALSSTIPGWQAGLVGKKAGSRVLLVLPPADGFPKGSNNPPLDAGDTIVYVVDLLYTYAS